MYQSVGAVMESHFTLKAQLTRVNFLQNFFFGHVDTEICDIFLFINALFKMGVPIFTFQRKLVKFRMCSCRQVSKKICQRRLKKVGFQTFRSSVLLGALMGPKHLRTPLTILDFS